MHIITRKLTLSIIFILLLFEKSFSFEKVGTTSFQFLKVMTSARGCALGEAFSAATNHSDAIFFNPAALTRIRNFDVSVDYLDYFLDLSHYAVAAAYTVQNLGTFGFHAIVTDVGEIKVTTVDALGFVDGVYLGYTGETIKPGSQVFGLSFARELTDKFSFGITAKYAREDLSVKSADNFMFDAGLTYDTGFKSLILAASVRHFGPEVKFYDKVNLPRYDASTDSTYYRRYTGKSYPLPQTFNIGIAFYPVSNAQGSLLHSDNQTLLLAIDMVQPRDYDQQYNLGLEYGFNKILFLRGGYKVNYDEESFSAGFGLAINKYRIDYSYSDFGDYLDSLHRFSFGYSLN
ncbi:PorV/PorQ family protein [candidate division KSB1 bacterium]|nr:PorV/PorQ family protein [candidate division KSB1 bacterium]